MTKVNYVINNSSYEGIVSEEKIFDESSGLIGHNIYTNNQQGNIEDEFTFEYDNADGGRLIGITNTGFSSEFLDREITAGPFGATNQVLIKDGATVVESVHFSYDRYGRKIEQAGGGMSKPSLLVDFNNDGVTNTSDIPLWAGIFFALDPVADLNGDGAVNNSDNAVFAQNYNQKLPINGLVCGDPLVVCYPDDTMRTYEVSDIAPAASGPRGDGVAKYVYDSGGRMVHQGSQHYVYGADGRVSEIYAGTTKVGEYRYDYSGRRLAKTHTPEGTSNQETVVYALPGYLHSTKYGKMIDYQFGDFHMQWRELNANEFDGNLLFFVDDYRGDVIEVWEQEGIVSKIDYYPYGGVRERTGNDVEFAPGFAGNIVDLESGLYDFNLRLYSADLGRFITPDPKIGRAHV